MDIAQAKTNCINPLKIQCRGSILTLVVIFGGDSEYRVLNVLIFIYLSLVEAFVEVRWVIVLVSYSNPNEFGYCNKSEIQSNQIAITIIRIDQHF